MSFHLSQRTLYNHLLNNFINRRTFSSFSNVIKNVINSRHKSCVNLLRPTRQAVQVTIRRHIHLQKIGVLGVPLNKGQGKQGVELGPKALRDNGLITSLEDLGHRINDYGDVQFENFEEKEKLSNIHNALYLSSASKKISKAVKKVIQAGEICLTLGGDHSMTTGAIHGHAQVQPDLVILWVDAHADINTPAASLSGHMHGMPLSFLIKEVQPYMSDAGPFDWVKPCVSAQDLVYIGLRDVDAAERWLIEKLGICTFSMQELDTLGIAAVLKMALSSIDPEGNRPIHVSFDIDSVDPLLAGSTGTPARGGLTYRESMYIAEIIAQTGRLSALDIVEVNPLLGSQIEQECTVNVAKDFALTIFGKQRCGTFPPRFTFPGRSS